MKKLLLAVAIVAIFVATHDRHHDTENLVLDRVWIDHIPSGERDPLQVFVAVSDHAIGEFFTGTRWQGKFDAFKFESSGDELRVVFPQTGTKEKLDVTAKACDVRNFHYCLEISGSSFGAKRYYSRKEWVIDPHQSVEEQIQALVTP